MVWDLIQIFFSTFSIFIIWVQRKTIFQLQNELWELERAYRNEVGKFYRYKYQKDFPTSDETT